MKFKNIDNSIKLLVVGIILILFYKMFTLAPILKEAFLALMGILKPFIYGFILAFLVYPFEQKVEGILIKKYPNLEKKKRLISSLIVFFTLLLIIIFFVWIIAPVIYSNGIEFVNALVDSIPSLEDSIERYVSNESVRETIIKLINQFDLTTILKNYSSLPSDAATLITNYIGQIKDAIIGFVLCPYFLCEKDSLNTIFINLLGIILPERRVSKIDRYLETSSVIFYNFIYGKVIDSAIIGAIALAFLVIFGYRFAVIYALIIGVTNIIPYFGPFIGGIPVTIMSFLTNGFIPAVICGIFILVLQWFDGLVLGPYILGEQVGVRPFWIVFAITFFQGLFGFVGMIIGVPMIAIIGMLLNELVAKSKRKRKIAQAIKENEQS